MGDWMKMSLEWQKSAAGRRRQIYRAPIEVAGGEPTVQAQEFADLLASGRRVIWYPIRPMPKPRMTRSDKWKRRPCVIKYRAYKDACKEGRVAIPMARGTVIFCLPIPKMSKAKTMALEATDHTKENADIDNLMKGLMDAVLIKDGEVCSLSPHKIWSSKPGFFIIWPTPEHDTQAARDVC